MIACTFLLGLVKDGRDPHTNLGAYLQKCLGGPTTKNIHDIVKRLKARGGCFSQDLLDQAKALH